MSLHALILGIISMDKAKTGNPSVPVEPLVTMVDRATSGAPSYAPRRRFMVGEFGQEYSRIPQWWTWAWKAGKVNKLCVACSQVYSLVIDL